MRGGHFVISVSDVKFRNYTGLQVTKDPGVPVVYAGFILMIIGCYITFFMFHQKICIELTQKDSLTSVSVYGVSGKNRPGMMGKTKRLAKHLKSIV
jgi:cytochrome c biogenesis protein